MRATVVLVAVNVLVYVAMLIVSGGRLMGFDLHTLLAFGASYLPSVTEDGEVWRLFTSTMVHLNVVHIVMNMMALVQVGRVLEPRWGAARVLIAYGVTGLGGSCLSLAYYGLTRPTVSAGASGAICGLIGASAVAYHIVGGPEGLRVRNAMLRWMAILLAIGILPAVTGASGGIDNAAHIGGLLSGALLGLAVEKKGIRSRGTTRSDVLAIAIFLVLAGGAFAIALTSSPGPAQTL